MKRFLASSAEADPLSRGGALDLLRFLAAGFIVLYHYEAYAPAAFEDVHVALTRGYLGTDFFLMLSGYVLGRTYGTRLDRVGPTGFLVRRVARVWPGHLMVLAAVGALVLAAQAAGLQLNNPQAFDWSALPFHALLMQAWGFGVPYGWNNPTWSLSALIICYAAFPLLWPLFKRLSGPAAVMLSVFAILAADLALRPLGHVFYDLPAEVGVLRALPLFAFGMALARYGAPKGLTLSAARVIGLGALAAFFALQLLGQYDFASILLIGVIVVMAGAKTPPRTSDLVRRGAELSFALYVTHMLAGMVWYRVLGMVTPELDGPAAWALWASGFPVAMACAWLFHRLVDMPVQDWIKPRLNRERRPAAVEPAVV